MQLILIVSDLTDLHVYWVTYYLRKWNIPYAQFNVVDYPSKASISFLMNSDQHSGHIVLPGNTRIELSDVGAVWYRKPDEPQVAGGIDDSVKQYAYDESRQALYGLYARLSRCFWISPLESLKHASNKPHQLRLASSLGFTIPDTIVTNDPQEAWNFYENSNGRIIYKSLSTGLIGSRRHQWEATQVDHAVYTTLIGTRSKQDFETVRNCPCLFQPYIPKKFEIRVTVVANEIFAAEIHSQENPATKVDWRREELDDITHKIHDLPADVSERCRLMVSKLGLNFGAIDMIYTPNNEYVFLEINPNGNFAWIEDRTGLKISETIAKTLDRGNSDTIA